MVKPTCSNFRVITANVLDVRIFRIFTVYNIRSFSICVFQNLTSVAVKNMTEMERLWNAGNGNKDRW